MIRFIANNFAFVKGYPTNDENKSLIRSSGEMWESIGTAQNSGVRKKEERIRTGSLLRGIRLRVALGFVNTI